MQLGSVTPQKRKIRTRSLRRAAGVIVMGCIAFGLMHALGPKALLPIQIGLLLVGLFVLRQSLRDVRMLKALDE